MRLVTLDSLEVGGRPGLLLPSGEILDLAASPTGLAASQWRPQSVVSILAQGAEGEAHVTRLLAEYAQASGSERSAWRGSRRLLPGAGTRLLPPIRRPGLLLMVPGGAGPQVAGQPQDTYIKNPNSAAGPDAEIELPTGESQPLHLLGMIGLTLGRALHRCNEAEALRALAAITLVADLGTMPLARSPGQQGPGSGDNRHARQFAGACVLGPALVTLDEIADDWILTIEVNGRTLQRSADHAAGIVRDPAAAAQLLTRLARHYAFRPGDVVAVSTGLPECELPATSSVMLRLGSGISLPFSTRG